MLVQYHIILEDETIYSGVEVLALLTFCKVSIIKDVFSSANEGGFGFDKFDDGGGKFDELPDSHLYQLHSCSREMCLTFRNLFLSVPLSSNSIVVSTIL